MVCNLISKKLQISTLVSAAKGMRKERDSNFLLLLLLLPLFLIHIYAYVILCMVVWFNNLKYSYFNVISLGPLLHCWRILAIKYSFYKQNCKDSVEIIKLFMCVKYFHSYKSFIVCLKTCLLIKRTDLYSSSKVSKQGTTFIICKKLNPFL